MLNPISDAALDWLGRLARPFVLTLIVGGAILIAFRSCNDAANTRTEARVGAAQAEAGVRSAKVAIDAVAASSEAERASEVLSQESEDAIRAAPGAGAPVDPRLRDVGLDRLCQRRTYRCEPTCVQRSRAAGVANAGAGCPAS